MTRRGGRREHLVVVSDGADVRAKEQGPTTPATHAEVLLDGRRYRLVPVDAEVEAEQDAAALTAREAQIVRLVAAGLVNKQIGAELRISEWTVATHLRRIFVKLNVDTRAAMVSRFLADARVE